MRATLLSWTLVFGLLFAGFGASVLALNNDLYSAHGFVRAYLETLARHDLTEALETDGVDLPAGLNFNLIEDAALGEVNGIRFISNVDTEGSHAVRFATTVDGVEHITEFTVERTGTRFGLFPTWRFAVSPVATLSVAVDNDMRFTANGVDARNDKFAVLVPGVFELDHESKYLGADAVTAVVSEVGSTVEATVQVVPNERFADAATTAVAGFLEACARQQVLKPTGCPFGTDVANRLDNAPTWAIVEYPTVKLSATETPGQWQTDRVDAAAHITAKVKSLFDGSITTLDQDIAFESSYLITVGADDSLSASAPVGFP